MKKIAMFTLWLLAVQFAVAQSKTVTGKVVDDTGEGLPGVSILIKNSEIGTSTDVDGNFSIEVPSNESILVVSFVGMKTEEVVVGSQVFINVALNSGLQLDEHVVTALGISKDKKKLGYSVQEVKGDEITTGRESNVVNALSGKVSGVQITNASGSVGASAKVVIRGNASISGDNQPLFVVNGIPMDNGNYASGDSPLSGKSVDYGNAISDINPEDIESISVLKGPTAAALYGSRGANGVVLITTKSGKNGPGKKALGITYSSNVGFQTPLRLPDFQNKFGQGTGSQFSYVDGNYGGLNDGYDESWGPAFDAAGYSAQDGIDNDGDGEIDEAGEGVNFDQYHGKNMPWVANPNNARDLFETGITMSNSIAVVTGDNKLNARVSYTNVNQKGMMPNTDLKRNSLNLAMGSMLSEKITINGNVTYTNTKSDNRPGGGYAGDNVMQQLIWSGRQIDMKDLKENWDTQDEFGNYYNWNHSYQNNPYFTLYNNVKPMARDRVNGMVSANYQFTDWLSLTARAGNDFYSEHRKRIWAKQTADFKNGRFEEDMYRVNEMNSDFLFQANKKINDNFELTGNFGGNHMARGYERSTVTVTALAVPEVYNVSNADGNPVNEQFVSRKEINSLYGIAGIGYKSYLFLDLTGRNDWSSTLPSDHRSYFYPSVTGSMIVSEMISLPKTVDLLKLRSGWAKVGSDTDPYQLSSYYQNYNSWAGVPSFTMNNVLYNSSLRPEQTNSFEVGMDINMFLNRLGLDLTYYNATTYDQIIPLDVAPSTGYTGTFTNAGTIQNSGVEIMLHLIPIKKENFSWNIDVNWAKNKSMVKELPEGIDAIRLGRFWGLDLEARVGEEFGVFVGNKALYNEEGKLILDGGLPQLDPERKVLGSITPDWIGGIRNSFRYKNWNMSVLVDMKKGGDLFSLTYMFGRYAGVLEESLEGRETLEQVTGGYAYDGVNADGSPNETKIDAETWNAFYYQSLGGHDRSVFDASFLKLREVTLGYDFKFKKESAVFKGMTLAVYGRNLALLHTNAPHIDPETSLGNATGLQGFEFGQLPSARTVGFSLNFNL